MIEYKSPEQIRRMRRAGLVVADIHDALREQIEVGMTTADLDAVALEVLESAGAVSNFYGYYGYPGQICTSVNEVIVHGIPGERVLEPGDLVSLDCGAVVDGWHGDAAFSVVLPGGDPEVRATRERLSEATRGAMWAGIAAMARGKRVNDIGAAIDDYVSDLPEDGRPDIVRDYVGHGIGTAMHQEPDVLNYRARGRSPRLKNGMVLCIEPMLTAGDQANTVLADEWTVITRDGSDAAHWEHMVAKHSGGIWVLTAKDGGAEGLAPFGVTPVPLS
ncbi:type I methionyl aminopeptidase [Trueperella bialowiezensis]|uniref:Methionine aminopeptidase n=1 Tax=Trueperella bialowiezensis TaxID=312285 RepID=A0A3S5EVZ8_9ACTO|nr:type I methionyl aminopeptidase [Trueperella bialowiezensis]VEI12828.1 Methionine aminopeptidase 1 [Trueperella bialowiezensis]